MAAFNREHGLIVGSREIERDGRHRCWRGPAGVFAARRAADLGAKATLITRLEFGGTAANDGPVPVRTLAHAARLIRNARELGRYGISVSEPVLDYPRLLVRVAEVVNDVRGEVVWS